MAQDLQSDALEVDVCVMFVRAIVMVLFSPVYSTSCLSFIIGCRSNRSAEYVIVQAIIEKRTVTTSGAAVVVSNVLCADGLRCGESGRSSEWDVTGSVEIIIDSPPFCNGRSCKCNKNRGLAVNRACSEYIT